MRLVKQLQIHGADRRAQEAACAVMRYFDTAAPHHHDDEEQDLFPALLDSMAGLHAGNLRELIESLCSDHHRLELHWAIMRERLAQVAQGEASTLGDTDIPGFVQLYEQHIAREEAELLPVAARVLSGSEQALALTCNPRLQESEGMVRQCHRNHKNVDHERSGITGEAGRRCPRPLKRHRAKHDIQHKQRQLCTKPGAADRVQR